MIEDRPEKVKEGLISILKGLKEKQTYFKTTDFEAMFDSYTFFEANNQVPSAYLLQALQKIEISRTKEQLLATYPQIAKTIGKTDFVNILTEEYRKKVSRI